jgi:hypothetical protein
MIGKSPTKGFSGSVYVGREIGGQLSNPLSAERSEAKRRSRYRRQVEEVQLSQE